MALHLYNRPHPGLSTAPSEREWTRDMDDMLRLHLRRSGFLPAGQPGFSYIGGLCNGVDMTRPIPFPAAGFAGRAQGGFFCPRTVVHAVHVSTYHRRGRCR